MSTTNGSTNETLRVILVVFRPMFSLLDDMRAKKQDAFNELREKVGDQVRKELDGKRIDKEEHKKKLRETWDLMGGAKVFAELKVAEKNGPDRPRARRRP